MADYLKRKLSFPRLGKHREASDSPSAPEAHAEEIPPAEDICLHWDEDRHAYHDPACLDAAEILSSCDAIPIAMALPSIQEAGPGGGETSEYERDNSVEEVGICGEERRDVQRHADGQKSQAGPRTRGQTAVEPATRSTELETQLATNAKLREEIKSMSEQMATYERRLAAGKGAGYKEECAKLREDLAVLQEENSALQYEIDQLNKVASYVGNRVAKVLVGARRANNYNSSLVAELKRWNRKLEVENQRLYAIIDRLQNRDAGSDTASMASEMSYHPRDDSALLVKRLEEQNRNLQREISALSADAANLQHLSAGGDRLAPRALITPRPPAPMSNSSDCDHSTSSGSADGPKTPSLHEEDGPGGSKSEERGKAEAARAETEALREQMDRKLAEARVENVRLLDELERMNVELAVLQSQVAEMEELKAQYQQQCKEVLALKESLVRLRREAVVAREFRDENMRLEDELTRVTKQNEEFEGELEELEAEVDRLQAMVSNHPAATGQMATLEEQVTHLQATNTLLQESLQQLRMQHHALLEKTSVAEARKGTERTVGQFRQLKAPSSLHMSEQLRELREENARLAERATRVDSLQQQLADAEKQISALKGSVSGDNAVEALHAKRVEALKGEEEQLKQQIATLKEQLEVEGVSASSYAALKKETKSSRRQLDKLLAENRQLGEKAVQAELALADLRAIGSNGGLEAQLASALAESQILRRDKERALADLAVTRQEVATLTALQGSSSASDEMERLRSEFDSERQHLETALKEQKGAVAEVTELRATLQAVRAEAATTALRADTLLAQKETLEARLAAGAETLAMAADSTALIRNARTEAEGLRSQNQNYQEELQALRLRVQELKNKEIGAPMFGIKGRSESSTVMGLRKDNAALKAQLDGLTELKAENEKLRMQLAVRPDSGVAVGALQKDVEALRSSNRGLESRVQQLQVAAAEMEALRGSVLRGRSPQEVVSEVRSLVQENNDLRQDAGKARSLAASLQDRLTEAQAWVAAATAAAAAAAAAPQPSAAPAAGPATPEPSGGPLRPAPSPHVASHSLDLSEGDGDATGDVAGVRGPLRAGGDGAEEWVSADAEVHAPAAVTAAVPSEPRASPRGAQKSPRSPARSFWNKPPRMFGTFLKRSALPDAAASVATAQEAAPEAAAVISYAPASMASELEELDAISTELAEQQVHNAYSQFGEEHDVAGFMQALGFEGFANGMARKPLTAVFMAAITVTNPTGGRTYESLWDKELAAAAHRTLVKWSKSTGL